MDEKKDRIQLEEEWRRSVTFACVRFLQTALWRQGAASNDLVDSIAAELAEKASPWSSWCHDMRGNADIVTHAIAYLATKHDGPWRGVEWFDSALSQLIELAVPNGFVDDYATDFLREAQVGVSQALQNSPIAKQELRITDAMAHAANTLKTAGQEYGLVQDLIELAESIFHGDALSEQQTQLLLIAATAAPFSRIERSQTD